MNLEGIENQLLFQENWDNQEKGLEKVKASNIQHSIIPELGVRRGVKYYYKLYRWLRDYFKEERPDVLVTHTPLPGYIGRLAARGIVPKTVHIFHGHYFHSYFSKPVTEFLRRLEKYLAKNTTQIITISPELRELLSDTYKIAPAEDILVQPIHIDLSEYQNISQEDRLAWRQKYNVPEGKKILVTVGRVAPIKNQKLFIDLLHRLSQNYDEVAGILVGKGESLDELIDYANGLDNFTVSVDNLDTNKTLSFVGERTDIPDILGGSDVFVLTSLNEGTPLTILEAQAVGLPVLSTDVGGVHGIVDDGRSAFLSPSDDLTAMYENALRVLDSNLSQETAISREKIIDKYDLNRKKESMETFYKNL